MAYTSDGQFYFIDHTTKRTTYDDPRVNHSAPSTPNVHDTHHISPTSPSVNPHSSPAPNPTPNAHPHPPNPTNPTPNSGPRPQPGRPPAKGEVSITHLCNK